MCHPTGSGAGSIFFSGYFFVFLFLLSSVPPPGRKLICLPSRRAMAFPPCLPIGPARKRVSCTTFLPSNLPTLFDRFWDRYSERQAAGLTDTDDIPVRKAPRI